MALVWTSLFLLTCTISAVWMKLFGFMFAIDGTIPPNSLDLRAPVISAISLLASVQLSPTVSSNSFRRKSQASAFLVRLEIGA